MTVLVSHRCLVGFLRDLNGHGAVVVIIQDLAGRRG